MRNTTLLLALAFAATTLSGCDDDATKVCKKMNEIMSTDEGAGAKMKEQAADLDGCKKKMAEQEKKDPEAFKKMAGCVEGVTDLNGLFECMMPAAPKDGDKE